MTLGLRKTRLYYHLLSESGCESFSIRMEVALLHEEA